METTTKASRRHLFDPRSWTALTWLGALLWLWNPFWMNYVQFPIESFTYGPGGELMLSETYESMGEMPFPWGWPFSYIVPDTLGQVPIRIGNPAPPPMPASVSWVALGANVLLIVFATAALIYFLQKLFPKFSIRSVMAVMLLFAIYFTVMPRLAQLIGYDFATYLSNAFYFSPVLIAILIKASQELKVKIDVAGTIKKMFLRRQPDCDSPEDVLAYASQLDHEGRWEEALTNYRQAALRWPDRAAYIENCIASIDTKKAAGE